MAIKRRFSATVNEQLDAYQQLLRLVDRNEKQRALETLISEQVTFACLSLWEAFVSDLMMAYVVEGPQKIKQSIERRLKNSVSDKFGTEVWRAIDLSLPTRLNRSKVALIADPNGRNLSAKSAKDLTDKANELLTAATAKNFSWSADEAELLDFLIPLRNFLAHRSPSSKKVLRKSRSGLTQATNADLKGGSPIVGVYLKEQTSTGERRAAMIAKRLLALSQRL